MTLKNFELKDRLDKMDELKDLTGFKFVLALVKNKKLIEQEIDDLSKIAEEPIWLTEVKQKFQAKQIELADKGDNDQPKFTEDKRNLVISDANKKKLEKFLTKLEKDNQEGLKAQQEKEMEFSKALNEDCVIDFVKIKESDIPKDITVEQLDLISFMVDLK